jgi:Icc-related predicted phosphoesterase
MTPNDSVCPILLLSYTIGLRIGWLTDLHLNFVSPPERTAFYSQLRARNLDAILLGGDIGEADSVTQFLAEIESALQMPIYFVLGNHDFYRGSIAAVRDAVARQAAASRWLRWLPASGVVPLTDSTALAGHDSWADGRLGDFFRSEVLLNDYLLISELSGQGKRERYAQLNALGDEAAEFLERRAREALAGRRNIIVLTHPPPFRESCWHEGRISDDDYLPHFACKAVGERLAAIMRDCPGKTMTVLCGHTHSSGFARILDNLVVYTGHALYGEPELQRVFELE